MSTSQPDELFQQYLAKVGAPDPDRSCTPDDADELRRRIAPTPEADA